MVINCSAQDTLDLFSAESTQQFANHLYKTGQFEEAGNEYMRLYHLGSNKEHLVLMSKSYRKARLPQKALINLTPFQAEPINFNKDLALEFCHVLMALADYNELLFYAKNHPNLPDFDAKILEASALLQLEKWSTADSILVELPENHQIVKALKDVAKTGKKLKKNNKLLAAGMSAIVPGTGKIYSGQWKDGLLSLLVVSTTSWQAYTGFNKNGIKSAYGWIFGALAAGFYLGNIYGTATAIERRNALVLNRLITRVNEAYFSWY
ncbi:MAG: hypothetical protein KDC92_05355 [Bacteroidetes bacterium]|nr:hypothetical protein [Bacteroidota bacterium]